MEMQGKGWLGGWEEKQIGGLCSVSPGLVYSGTLTFMDRLHRIRRDGLTLKAQLRHTK